MANVWIQPLAGGAPTQLSHFATDVMPTFDVSPDGKRVLMNRGSIKTDVVLTHDLK